MTTFRKLQETIENFERENGRPRPVHFANREEIEILKEVFCTNNVNDIPFWALEIREPLIFRVVDEAKKSPITNR